MAEINKMNFTYPILCKYNDDYVGSEFTAGTMGAMEKSKRYSKIKTFVEITDPKINKFIDNGTAKIIMKVYCNSTKYRNIFEIKRGIDEIVLQNRDVNNRVELSTFIVITESINNYTNQNFNKDYKGKSFNLEKGSIIAIGKQEKIFIEKDVNDLTKLNSIITICRDDTAEKSMSVDFSDEKIRIKLSAEEYETYSMYSKHCVPIVNSMIIIPAIMYVLDEIAKEEQDESDYIDKKWYRVISKKATELIGKNFTVEYIRNCGSFELVQKMFENPICDALNMIKNKWDNEVDYNDN